MSAEATAATPVNTTTTAPPSTPDAARYLVKGILPAGEMSILSGASGAGKSTMIAQMLATIQAGEHAFLGHEINYPIRIGYIAADRTWDSYDELARRVGLDTRQLQVRSVVDDLTIDVDRLERDSMDLLKSLIKSFDRPNLVVIDPMVVFLGVDPNKYNSVAPRLIKMGRWCKEMNLTILATHHATKARTDYSFKRPQDRISGSSALLGFTSSQLFLSSADELGKPYSEFTAVNHNDPPVSIRLMRNERGLFVPFQDNTISQPFATSVMRVIGAEGAVKSKIAADTKIDPQTLDHILDYLSACGNVRVDSRGHYRKVADMPLRAS